ncbi:MAG: hypothetical protein ABI091_22265 [Ferruginibacter sp.]
MMAFIFAFYLLAISARPCVCINDCALADIEAGHSTSKNQKQQNETCTAFCNCTCCCAPVVSNYVEIKITLPLLINNCPKFSLNNGHYLSDHFQNIWQPPKSSC